MNKGLLIVVSGPSGCGKGTILEELKKRRDFYYSVSATTRAPRDGEIDGIHYHFKTIDEFEKLMENDGMIEYAKYCDNYYGTPRKEVIDKLNQGKDVILEIEVQGALNVRKSYPEAVLIFILPPSLKELRRRLNKRGTETEERIEKRIAKATEEINTAVKYDYVIINSNLIQAVNELDSIIISEKSTIKRAEKRIREVLENA